MAFRLYCRTPFGILHQYIPEIMRLAALIDRTASAIAMKACKFACFDPAQGALGVNALRNVSKADGHLWSTIENTYSRKVREHYR